MVTDWREGGGVTGRWKRAGVADVGRSRCVVHRAKDLNAQKGSRQRLALEGRSGRCWEMGCGWKRQELVDAVAEREQWEMSRFGLNGWLGCSTRADVCRQD